MRLPQYLGESTNCNYGLILLAASLHLLLLWKECTYTQEMRMLCRLRLDL